MFRTCSTTLSSDVSREIGKYLKSLVFSNRSQSQELCEESKWPSWAPVPNKPTVSVDVKPVGY